MAHETILLADDSPEEIAAIRLVLKRAGISNPVQVVNGSEGAMSYLNGEGIYEYRNVYPIPALLLVALKMSGRSGFDVLEWIMANPDIRPKVIVALIGIAGSTQEIRRAYKLGANSILVKPLRIAEVLEVLSPVPGIEFHSRPEIRNRD